MEEEKAAAYYEELTRKGEGAARFKQGLGFSSSSASGGNEGFPARGSALPSSSSSFLSQFVRASSPNSNSKLEKDSDLRSIRDKLRKKPDDQKPLRVSERSHRDSDRNLGGSRSRERDDRARVHRRRSRSKSRERDDRERRHRRRSRSRSRSRSRERRREREKEKYRDRGRERDWERRDENREQRREGEKGEKNGKVDYSRLIEGYDQMSAAERVKAKMKLQLASTAEKDKTMGAGWERFEFDKDAPVDDEEVEAADDDAALVKRIGQSFRFSAIEARREEQIKAAHDEAMFGAPIQSLATSTEDDLESDSVKNDARETNAATNLLSEKVLAKQRGSWRDRARNA